MDEREVLESWKEISDYLGRSVMTCHRWEAELGLPIHRLDGTPKARVFAYTDELNRWKAEKAHEHEAEREAKVTEEAAAEAKTESQVTGRLRGKTLKRIGIAAAVLLPAAGVALYFLLPRPLLPLPENKPSLAIVQFENPGGDERLDAWTTALPDLLITDLMQSRYVTVPGVTDTYRKLQQLKLADAERFTDEDLKKVAELAKVDFVATGSLRKSGFDVAVEIVVQNPKTGKAGAPFGATFRLEKEIFTVADGLTRKIKTALGLGKKYVSRDIDEKARAISTASPEAFKDFSQGYRLAGISKYPESIVALQRSVEIDPEFALAYKYLYRACQNSAREEDEKAYVRKAVELAGRLSERERDQLLVIYYDGYEIDAARRMDALEKLVDHYPDDLMGSGRLLNERMDLEDWDKALVIADRAWRANKSDWPMFGRMIQCRENLGQIDLTDRLLADFDKDNPGHQYEDANRTFSVWYAIRRGRLDEALKTVEEAMAKYQNHPSQMMLYGTVHFYRDEYEAAGREYLKAAEQSDPMIKLEGQMLLRDLCLARGRIEEGRTWLESFQREIEKIETAPGKKPMPASMILSRKGAMRLELAYLHRLARRYPEALAEVEATLRDHENRPGKEKTPPPLELLHMQALLTLDLGREAEFERQAERIRKQIEESGRPRQMRIYHHLLGRRELKKNNVTEAIRHFSKAVDLVSVPGNTVASAGPDPRYFYSLAEAYDRLGGGHNPQALALYQKLTQPIVNRLHSGDLYALSLYKIAGYHDIVSQNTRSSIDVRKAARAEAIKYYRKFLSIWKDADPIFPEVDDARERLAKLGAQ